MNWFERWHKFADRQAEREAKFISKYFNLHTYIGNFRNILLLAFGWYVMWHIYDINTWIENLLDLHYDPPTEADKSWLRLWMSLICGWGISLSIYSIIKITIGRLRERKNPRQTTSETEATSIDETSSSGNNEM